MSVAETSAPTSEQFTFQTEIKQLLHLLSHSLYQHREIALRELISNASDALNKLRHIQLAEDQYRDETPLEISLEVDKADRVLTIRDNGIGLTREELVENLGTIAHSGSLAFLNQLPADRKSDLSLIGQFGVGFYSAFMLADKVEVLTRSYRDEQGYRWESDGTGRFTITPVDNVPRGAQIRLHLKTGSTATAGNDEPDEMESFSAESFSSGSFDDYLDAWKLERVIGKYSTFVPFPIRVDSKQVNTQRPIWVEPKSQVTEEQYKDFYGFLSHAGGEPRWHLHVSADSPIQFHAIVYCPTTNMEKLGFGKIEKGLHLCAKRILVQDDNRDLLPEYLRFLTGLVDSADLPLNVSRETLQDNTVVPKIRRILTRKVLDHLDDWSREAPEKYREFWDEFGSLVRTGIVDWETKDRVAKLLRFDSTKSANGQPVSLREYKERMVEGQTQIYFACGPDAAALRHNPHLELYEKRGTEVLLIVDPVDEWVLTQLRSFDDTPIIAIDSSEAAPPKGADASDEAEESKAAEEPAFKKLLEVFRDALGDKVSEVRASTRLADSPVCLVNPAGAFTPQLQMLLKSTQKDFEFTKRVFEVNPKSALINRLSSLAEREDQVSFLRQCAAQLYAEALLLEGVAPSPHESVERMRSFLTELAEQRSK